MNVRAAAVSLAMIVLRASVPAAGQQLALPPTTAASVTSVRQLLDEGRFADAETEARALYVARGGPGPRASAAAELYVEALLRNGRGGEPGTRTLARSLPATGSGRRLLGGVLIQSAAFVEAVERLVEAARLDRLALGRSHLRVADDLDGLARACTWLERYTEALRVSNRAVAIYEQTTPSDPAGLARVLTTRGTLLQGMARHKAARADLERAAGILEGIAPLHPDMAVTLTALGLELQLEGDVAGSRAILERATRIAERSLRPDHPDVAAALRALAVPLTEAGELERAKTSVERALAIAERAYGPVHPLVAMQLNDLADSFAMLGQYAEARPLQQRALDIYERTLGRHNSYVATAVLNLALLNESIGDYQEAERLHRRAILTWGRAVGQSHTYLAWALVGLADVLAAQGRYREAVPLYSRGLAIRESRLGASHDQVAETLTKLSGSLIRLRRTVEATRLADRALAICEASRNPRALSEALLVRARIDMAEGRYAAARDRYRKALAIRLPVFGAAHPSVADAQAALAVALAAVGHPDEAFTLAMEAERVGRAHLRLTTSSLPERQALTYATSRPRGLDLALSIRSTAAVDTDLLDAVVRSRAVVLDEMASRQRLRAGAAGDELRPFWNRIASASQRLANLTVRGPVDLAPERYAAILANARAEKEDAEIALAARSSSHRPSVPVREVGFDDVRASLEPGTALVSFVRYARTTFESVGKATRRRTAPHYAAFVTRAGGVPVFVPLGSAAAVDGHIARWRQVALDGIAPDGTARPGSEAGLRRIGLTLAGRVWDPIAPQLEGVTQVFLVPDGALNLVPFSALPRGHASYLLDDGPTIHYLSAERDLVESSSAPARRGSGMLALGGPTYGATPSAPPGRRPRGAVAPDQGRRSACGTFETLFFPPLPASRREAEEVSRLWRSLAPAADGANAVVHIGAQAGEAAFKRDSRGYRVLHLATHGFFLGADCRSDSRSGRGVAVSVRPTSRVRPPSRPPESPLLLSGLALSGANRRSVARPNDEDGILTAEEVAALDLDGVEWAVLSACDTGLGEIRAGEGVFGLRRAFRVAGAQTVIMSLWPVEDSAARAWMRALYEHRLGHRASTADAVREASRAVLRERRAKKLGTHPFYWAGFVAAGDWR